MSLGCSGYDEELLSKILKKIAGDSSGKLTRKTHEYLRLLKLKNSAGLMKITDSCAVVICGNLAAELLGSQFDKSLAIKTAGLTKKCYVSYYHTVKKMLGLDRPVSVSELSIKLACSQVSDLAQQLIDRYVSNREEGLVKCPPIDLTHPMYACAAVLAACRHRKVRVKRELLVDMSRVKAKKLDIMVEELVVLAEQMRTEVSRKRGHHLFDMVEEMDKVSTRSFGGKEDESRDEPQESFQEWKRRMLARPSWNT